MKASYCCAGRAGVAQSEVERVVEQLLTVGADVEHHRKGA